jgi:hypothetical protein
MMKRLAQVAALVIHDRDMMIMTVEFMGDLEVVDRASG